MIDRTFPKLTDAQMRSRLAEPNSPIRVVIDTDAHNEIDDQFALAWALLSQDVLKIEGVYAEPYAHLDAREPVSRAYERLKAGADTDELSSYILTWAQHLLDQGIKPADFDFGDPARGMALSYDEAVKIYELLDEPAVGNVFRGAPEYMPGPNTPVHSPAVDHLIERALSGGPDPLYVAAIGCITNVASAILIEPEIINHIVVLWTSAYPSTIELSNAPSLNLVQDRWASKLIFECGVPMIYLPGYHIGAQLSISLPEMERFVRGRGKIGDYLYELYTNNPLLEARGMMDTLAEGTWIVWDLINIAWLLNPDWVPSRILPTVHLDDELRWVHPSDPPLMREAYDIDRDAIYRDFYRKLATAP